VPSAKQVSSDVAFTDSVKAIQQREGSRQVYARMEQSGGFETAITPELIGFIGEQTSFFLATANSEGQPYIQHRGGPQGFLHVLDANTLAFADYRGNRQFISMGNLTDNPKVHVFLIDYAQRKRVKIWGTARVVDADAALLARLTPPGYESRAQRAFVIHVEAWDANCPQHIPQRFEAADVARAIEARDRRIAQLELLTRRTRALFRRRSRRRRTARAGARPALRDSPV
jgi:predicted pyridoxine 5'-phosphate oxidase superfamily flavin-nucleotide-binding protein